MFKTQLYLTETERKKLKERSKRLGISQSVMLREAVDQYLEKDDEEETKKAFEGVCGIWADRTDLDEFYKDLRKSSNARMKELFGE